MEITWRGRTRVPARPKSVLYPHAQHPPKNFARYRGKNFVGGYAPHTPPPEKQKYRKQKIRIIESGRDETP